MNPKSIVGLILLVVMVLAVFGARNLARSKQSTQSQTIPHGGSEVEAEVLVEKRPLSPTKQALADAIDNELKAQTEYFDKWLAARKGDRDKLAADMDAGKYKETGLETLNSITEEIARMNAKRTATLQELRMKKKALLSE